MSNTAATILDHIDNITVPGQAFVEASNEYWALACMHRGMEYLYVRAKHCDDSVNQKIKERFGEVRYSGSGNAPVFEQISQPLLTVSFHWYAMSAYQYALIVGAIAQRQDPSRLRAKAYVEKVMPEVLAFRNKVAAHLAWAIDDKRDNDAEKLASVLPPLSFVDDSWHVGDLAIKMTTGGKSSTSESLRPWSICKVHEQLRVRYWPELAAAKSSDKSESDSSKPTVAES